MQAILHLSVSVSIKMTAVASEPSEVRLQFKSSSCLFASLLPSQFATLIKTMSEEPGNESDDIIVLYSSDMRSHMCMHIDVGTKNLHYRGLEIKTQEKEKKKKRKGKKHEAVCM